MGHKESNQTNKQTKMKFSEKIDLMTKKHANFPSIQRIKTAYSSLLSNPWCFLYKCSEKCF